MADLFKIKIICKDKNEKGKKEKYKKGEHQYSQEEREGVLESKPLLDITHIFNEKNSSLEL